MRAKKQEEHASSGIEDRIHNLFIVNQFQIAIALKVRLVDSVKDFITGQWRGMPYQPINVLMSQP